LVVLEQAIGIFAIATVGGPTRRLDVNNLVRLGTQNAKERFRVHGARPDLDVIRLLDDAPKIAPILLKLKDEVLKGGPLQFSGGLGVSPALHLMFFFRF
jgi:hypothetical protein